MKNRYKNSQRNFENEERKDTMKLKSMYVTDCARLNVRDEPDSNANVMATLSKDDRVLVFADFEHDAFYKIRMASNSIGYVVKKYLTDRF